MTIRAKVLATRTTPRAPGSDWTHWRQPNMRRYHLVCCDCNLTHQMQYRVVYDPKGRPVVQYRCRRADLYTHLFRKRNRDVMHLRKNQRVRAMADGAMLLELRRTRRTKPKASRGKRHASP